MGSPQGCGAAAEVPRGRVGAGADALSSCWSSGMGVCLFSFLNFIIFILFCFFSPFLALRAVGAQRCALFCQPGSGAVGRGGPGRRETCSGAGGAGSRGPGGCGAALPRSRARGGSAAGRGRTKEGGDELQHNVPPPSPPPPGSGQGQHSPPAGAVGRGCGETGDGETGRG